jgi:uncharacterized protein YcbK (DUF882 family)
MLELLSDFPEMSPMNRRLFLRAALAAAAGFPALVGAQPVTQASNAVSRLITWPKDMRWLWLQRESTGEESKIIYYHDAEYHVPGYIEACKILRDVHAPKNEQVVQMDIILLDLLFACQEWLRLNNILRPIRVLSGYRTIHTNAHTEGSAKNSMHMYGKAADIRIPGLPTDYLVQLGKWFQTGGIGWYPHSAGGGFVHLDTGPVRQWVK